MGMSAVKPKVKQDNFATNVCAINKLQHKETEEIRVSSVYSVYKDNLWMNVKNSPKPNIVEK